MSSDKPSTITPAVILSVVALVAAIAGPAINYGASDGSKAAEIGALRERVSAAEVQISELRKELRDFTKEAKSQIEDIRVSAARMEGAVNQFVGARDKAGVR